MEYFSASNCVSIENSTFYGKQKLSSFYAPKTKHIGHWAFYSTGLTDLNFPEVEYIGEHAFHNCASLSGTISIGPCTSGIHSYAFTGTNISEIKIARGSIVSGTIYQQAFVGLSTLTSVDTGTMVYVSSAAFMGCTNLKTFIGPEIEFIYYSAFNGCNSLETVSLPKCTELGYSAFAYNRSPLVLQLPECKKIDYSAFHTALIKEIHASKCSVINGSAFFNCSNLSIVDFPSCSYVGYSAFFSCTGLSCIPTPNVQVIEGGAFMGCSLFSKVSISTCRY